MPTSQDGCLPVPRAYTPQYAWGTGREKKRQVQLKKDSSKLLLRTLEQPPWFLSWSLSKHSFLVSEYKCSNVPAAIEQIKHWSLTPYSNAYIAACWLLSNVVSIIKHMWCHDYGHSNVSGAFMWASSSVNSGRLKQILFLLSIIRLALRINLLLCKTSHALTLICQQLKGIAFSYTRPCLFGFWPWWLHL